jgi:hypothetical protein
MALGAKAGAPASAGSAGPGPDVAGAVPTGPQAKPTATIAKGRRQVIG